MRRKEGSITKEQLRGKGGRPSSSVRLDFSQSPLYGRDKERKIMRETYSLATLGKSQTVFVKGASGSGKTTFVEASLQKAVEATGGLWYRAKFHEDQPRAPHTAIVTLFTKLLHQVTIDPVRIKEEMGPDVQCLFPLLPRLREEMIDCQASFMPPANDAYALDRFLRLFVSLLKAVISSRQPLVLFWDDIHWADDSSLRFIRHLITDSGLKHVLIVATYRQEQEFQLQEMFLNVLFREGVVDIEEINGHHFQTTPCDADRNVTNGGINNIVHLTLGALEFDDINQMIAGSVGTPAEVAEPLTLVVYRTTGGNCFHTLQFVGSLQDEDYLYYFPAESCWEYDLDGIVNDGANLAVSAEELVIHRIRQLSSKLQNVLKLASCIGFTFDRKLLLLLLQDEFSMMNMDEEKLNASLQILSTAGFLEAGAVGDVHFLHDRIRSCAYSMELEGKERDALHLRIGFLMQRLYEADSHFAKEWVFFALVDQLNWGSATIDEPSEKKFLIKLNLEAARQARQRSAFSLAAEYLELGIKLLGGADQWDEDYGLSLELTSFAAEMNLCSAKLHESQVLAQVALSKAQQVRHKIRLYYVMIKLASARDDPKGASIITVSFLRELGCQTPKRPNTMHIRSELAPTRRMLRGISQAEILSLPLATDPIHIASIKLLTKAFMYLAMARQPKRALAPICSCRAIQLSLKKGISTDTAAAFACYAITMCIMGNIREAERYSDISLKLLDRFRGCDEVRAIVSFLVFCKIHHWAHPLEECLEPFRCGYRAGIRSGSIAQGVVNAAMYGQAYYICGLPLLKLSSELKRFSQEVSELRQNGVSVILLSIIRQLTLNILGYAQDSSVLTGVALFQEDAEARANEEAESLCKIVLMWAKLELAIILHNSDTLEKLLPIIANMRSPRGKAHFGYVRESFLAGLAYISLARSNSKYRRHVKQHIARFRKWVKKGAVNTSHMLLLLRAEYAVSQKSFDASQLWDVMALYGEAIACAEKIGFTHDAAMAHEYAGAVCFRQNNPAIGSNHIARAFELYQEWGAFTKMEQLRHTYGFVPLGDPDSKSGSSGSNPRLRSLRRRKRVGFLEQKEEPELDRFPHVESMDALTEMNLRERSFDTLRRHSE